MQSPYLDLWELDSETTYLNHGSFGPSPKEVCAARNEWTARLERQPMRFLLREMEDLLENTATDLARFLQTSSNRLALVDNSTVAMNVAAASIDLGADDEVIVTDHEYGAARIVWQQRCRAVGARIVTAHLPFPLDGGGIEAAIESAITKRTRVILISHVTSPTAAILPVKRICKLAKQRGIVTVIDGPHAIAMLDVQLDDLGCDFYCASCHKWLCASFGSGFLWAHPRHHARLRCPIVSWGGSMSGRAACWQDRINWLGTRDPGALLSASSAIAFMERIRLKTYRDHAHALICHARRRLLAIDGVGSLCTPADDDVVSMCTFEIPQPDGWQPGYHGQADPLQVELHTQHGIEVPVASWNGRRFLRVSAHLYNSQQDVDKLVDALGTAKHFR